MAPNTCRNETGVYLQFILKVQKVWAAGQGGEAKEK